MFDVKMDISGTGADVAKEFLDELDQVYVDMKIDDVSVSGNKITFKAGFSGLDDIAPDDVKNRIDEYLTENEKFQAGPIIVEPIPPPGRSPNELAK